MMIILSKSCFLIIDIAQLTLAGVNEIPQSLLKSGGGGQKCSLMQDPPKLRKELSTLYQHVNFLDMLLHFTCSQVSQQMTGIDPRSSLLLHPHEGIRSKKEEDASSTTRVTPQKHHLQHHLIVDNSHVPLITLVHSLQIPHDLHLQLQHVHCHRCQCLLGQHHLSNPEQHHLGQSLPLRCSEFQMFSRLVTL